MTEREALLTLYLIPSIGPTTLLTLKEQFLSYAAVLTQPPDQWHVPAHVKKAAQIFLVDFSIHHFIQRLSRLHQAYITWSDDAYPTSLCNISTPPPVLFYQGDITLLRTPCIAVVGTRNPTTYAEKAIQHLVPPLIPHYTIVSGFQRGVDQLAHHATLKAQGKTIAVLGTGLDVNYPSNSKTVRQEILQNRGLIISEFPPGTHPERGNFPRRNRIAAGLAKAVIVVEAALQSGSLVTANHAVEQGKEVFAVPGPIFSRYSEGTNYLIKQGAKLMASAHDLLGGEDRGTAHHDRISATSDGLTGWQKELYNFIVHANPTLDDCIEKFQRPTADLLSALTEMELSGIIQQQDGGIYEVA